MFNYCPGVNDESKRHIEFSKSTTSELKTENPPSRDMETGVSCVEYDGSWLFEGNFS